MTDALVRECLMCIWEKWPGANLDTRSLLILDSFRGHLKENVWQKLHACDAGLAIELVGMASVLRLLDMSIN